MIADDPSVDAIQAEMDAVPKIVCALCKSAKHPGLFTASQKKFRYPRCQKCMNKPRGKAR